MDKDKINILLKEYEILQNDANAIGSRFWTFTGIILGFSTAVLTGLGYLFISNYSAMEIEQRIMASIFVLILSACIIAMLVMLNGWKKHTNSVAEFNYIRARDIELELGMWKNLRFAILYNNMKYFSSKDEDCIKKYRDNSYWDAIRNEKNFFTKHKGDWYTSGILYIFISLWSITALASAVSLVIAFIKVC